jgi:hypothetical protein
MKPSVSTIDASPPSRQTPETSSETNTATRPTNQADRVAANDRSRFMIGMSSSSVPRQAADEPYDKYSSAIDRYTFPGPMRAAPGSLRP